MKTNENFKLICSHIEKITGVNIGLQYYGVNFTDNNNLILSGRWCKGIYDKLYPLFNFKFNWFECTYTGSAVVQLNEDTKINVVISLR
jgi:hypothetical protein